MACHRSHCQLTSTELKAICPQTDQLKWLSSTKGNKIHVDKTFLKGVEKTVELQSVLEKKKLKDGGTFRHDSQWR